MLTWVNNRLYQWDGVDPMRNPKEPAVAITLNIGSGQHMVAFHKGDGWDVIGGTVFDTEQQAKDYAETVVRLNTN